MTYIATAVIGTTLYGAYEAGEAAEDAAFAQSRSLRESSAARQAMARYNSAITMKEAESQKELIQFNARRLSEQQSGLQQEQRMNIAARGGVMGGTDLLLILDQAERMQMDQLELKREENLTIARAEEAAEKNKFIADYGSDADIAAATAAAAAGDAARTQAFTSGLQSAATSYYGFIN